ncbi:hypothetical protein BH23GEM1_BH23GEM1_12150 [soil metagenome]
MQDGAGQQTITGDQIREQIQQSIQDGIEGSGGGRIVVAPEAPVGVATTGYPPPWVDDIPPRVQETAIAFFVMLAVMVVGYPLAKAFGRRIDRAGTSPRIPAEVSSQLAQLNQAVESIAVEVERISEGQRFTTKLLAEQHKLPAASRNVS